MSSSKPGADAANVPPPDRDTTWDRAEAKRVRRAATRARDREADVRGRERATQTRDYNEVSRRLFRFLPLPPWHGIDDFCIRLGDNVAGRTVGLRPVQGKPGVFDEVFVERVVEHPSPESARSRRGFAFVGVQTWREAPPVTIKIADYREESRYDMLEIGGSP